MRCTVLRFAALTLSVLAAASAAQSPSAPPAASTPAATDSKPAALPRDAQAVADQIDPSMHFLRRQQLEDGSYGSVAATASVLRALAESPRKYVPSDGPFVSRALTYLESHQREDGAVCEARASSEQARLETELVLAALGALPVGTQQELVQRALVFLSQAPGAALFQPVREPLDGSAARARAAQIFSARAADGSYAGPPASVSATAAAIHELNACWRVLKRETNNSTKAPAKPLPVFAAADRGRALAALERGAGYLLAARCKNGLWGPTPEESDAGVSVMVLGALQTLPAPRSPQVQSAIDAGLLWLVEQQQPDGSIEAGGLANYVTSAGVMALEKSGSAEYAAVIGRAREFLSRLQADEGENYSESDRYYGGIGYGNDERPDLSNLQMALEAMHAAGTPADDPAFRKAMIFLQRCQNRSEQNDIAIPEGKALIKSGDDGGAGYAPGESKAGYLELGDGTKIARSYGSMSYALLKCYLFAGLSKEDPRVKALWAWLMKNWTLDVNPGFEALSSADPSAPYQGLMYYFHAMAKALALYGEELLTDGSGTQHNWRAELAGRLVAMQRGDGSWLNENSPRWWEGNPVLASAYAMLALGETLPPSGH